MYIYISLPDRDETINSSQQRRLVMAPLKKIAPVPGIATSISPGVHGLGMVDDININKQKLVRVKNTKNT